MTVWPSYFAPGIGVLIKYEKNFRTLIEELTANYERNKEFDT